MDEKMLGDRIRIESRSAAGLVALASSAAPAFARAAGGEPGAWQDLESAGRTALEAHAAAGAEALLLILRAEGVEIRPDDGTGADLLLTWPA